MAQQEARQKHDCATGAVAAKQVSFVLCAVYAGNRAILSYLNAECCLKNVIRQKTQDAVRRFD